jgi:hypothetical protein
MHIRIRWLHAALLLAGSSTASTVAAAPDDWVAVAPAVLDEARAGFTLPSGLAVGIGIERTVAVNGDVVAHTRFVVPDLRQLSSEQALQARDALSTVTLVQNGAARVDPAVLAGTVGATVIQNSLNDQHIQTRTVIDASVNSLASFKAINFQSSLGDAIARAAGAP